MERSSIDRLIINSPYEEPVEHWKYNSERRTFSRERGRRPAGYIVASDSSRSFDDPGHFVEIPLVNRIRPRIKEWREKGYPGVTGITKRLLEYWSDPEEFSARRFFFCQIEAVETLIWLAEAPEAERLGIEIPSDGGDFIRLCSKMATGSGKTIVMAMVIAWQVLNRLTYPRNTRFAKNILVVAPGLTVKNRLSVLEITNPENYYETFRIVPRSLFDKLRQGKVLVRNWHALNWESEEKISRKRSVDKRGAKSEEAYVREVLGDMSAARNILVINDEAHHAWRVPLKPKGIARTEIDEATKWVGGLDRINKVCGILTCYDFSATPFAPSGKQSSEEALFGWIVSDFGLNDAIESGIVKTPRVVIRDDAVPDAKSYKSRLYHIYADPEVKDDLNRKAKSEEPLPDLVINGYYLLGYDWRETATDWLQRSFPTPPVMITVANRTETAARVKHAFDHGKVRIDELCDAERTLHIDSKVLETAESSEEPIAEIDNDKNEENVVEGKSGKLTKKQKAELLRQQVDTVGKQGKAGEQIQNVISVGMLSEGWDAKTVTHIMGLRAFTSQLLCEQVVGRGLRRTSYDDLNPETGLFEPEHVNIFGVPFTFLPHEGGGDGPPPATTPKTAIEPVADKMIFEISWPNIIRIDHNYRSRLSLEWQKLKPLELDASQTVKIAELVPVVDGKPADVEKIEEIHLENLAQEFRTQRIIFETARDIYDQMEKSWQGGRAFLLAQLVRLVEKFICSDKIRIIPELFSENDLRRRLIITLNMNKVVQHMWEAIRSENTETLEPVFDSDQPIRSTGDMRTWYTGKPCGPTNRSHINFCVYDSTWEASDAFALDHAPEVDAWAKNDHLGFEVFYIYRGVVRKYRPDFIIRLRSGDMLVLETKGHYGEQDRAKQEFLQKWVKAVNAHGGFGRWSCDISMKPGDIHDILARHSRTDT